MQSAFSFSLNMFGRHHGVLRFWAPYTNVMTYVLLRNKLLVVTLVITRHRPQYCHCNAVNIYICLNGAHYSVLACCDKPKTSLYEVGYLMKP